MVSAYEKYILCTSRDVLQQKPFLVLYLAMIFLLDEFDYCYECGDEIEETRLLANPAFIKCMSYLKG